MPSWAIDNVSQVEGQKELAIVRCVRATRYPQKLWKIELVWCQRPRRRLPIPCLDRLTANLGQIQQVRPHAVFMPLAASGPNFNSAQIASTISASVIGPEPFRSASIMSRLSFPAPNSFTRL